MNETLNTIKGYKVVEIRSGNELKRYSADQRKLAYRFTYLERKRNANDSNI